MNITRPSVIAVEGQTAAPAPLTLFIGLDVHTGAIAVSIAPSGSTEVRRLGSWATQAH